MEETKASELKKPTEEQLTYNSYLKVHELLSLQQLQSSPEKHDETLFIIIHQVYELWFKQILHEFKMVLHYLEQNKSFLLIKTLTRIIRIQDVLIHQVSILETMTPNEFNEFRYRLNPASGFQSHQFRKFEFLLGMKDSAYLKYYDNDEKAKKELEEALHSKSIWDHFIHFFEKRGAIIPEEVKNRDISQAYECNEEMAKEFAKVYINPQKYNEFYEVMELLLDIDQRILEWRFKHIQMVQRVIGLTMGTGGSMGVQYLQTTLRKKAFPEIWAARKYVVDDLQ